MQHVSSFGGPRVLLPTSDVARWMNELGDTPTPDKGLYGLACSIDAYCGVVAPWETPLLIFGDDPADIYFKPDEFDGLFFRWVGADSLEQLTAFAIAEAHSNRWDETVHFTVATPDMTLMDTCAISNDGKPGIRIGLRIGIYEVKSKYVESDDVMTIIHRLAYNG